MFFRSIKLVVFAGLVLCSIGLRPAQAAYQPVPDVMNSGAKCDGTTDDTAAIQAAANIPGRLFVIIPAGRVCVVSPTVGSGLSGIFGPNSVALYPLSGQIWTGGGTLRVKAGSTATSGAILGNWQGNNLFNVIVDNVTFDGNIANAASAQMSGVVLVNCNTCTVRNSNFINNGYIGAQFTTTGNTIPSFNDKFLNNTVSSSSYICLQMNFPANALISGNQLSGCGNNGIDVYGNNASVFVTTAIVSNNIISIPKSTGIFIESLYNVDVLGNNCLMGSTVAPCVFLNQINTSGAKSNIEGNHAIGTTASGSTAYAYGFNNNSGYSNVSGNYADGFDFGISTQSITLGLNIRGNFFNVYKYLIRVPNTASLQFTGSLVDEQFSSASRSTGDGYPFTISPYFGPNNPVRAAGISVTPAFFVNGGALGSSGASGSLQAEFNNGNVGNLSAACPGFTAGSPAQNSGLNTIVCFDKPLNVGFPLQINGLQYISFGSLGSNIYVLGQNCTAASGNFAAVINGGSPGTWSEEWPAWCAD